MNAIEKLERVNKIGDEIKQLQRFERIFKTRQHLMIRSFWMFRFTLLSCFFNEFTQGVEVSEELASKIMKVIEEHLKEKEAEFIELMEGSK